MSEGEFKKRINELWQNVETPNTFLSPIDIHVLKRVLLGEAQLIAEDAKKEFEELIPIETKKGMYMGSASLIDSAIVWEKIKKWFGENRRV